MGTIIIKPKERGKVKLRDKKIQMILKQKKENFKTDGYNQVA